MLVRYNEHENQRRHAESQLQELDDYGKKGFDPEMSRMHNLYADRLKGEVEMARQRVEEMRPEMEEQQGRVLEARRKRRIVELIKERQKENYDREQKRLERKELDEARIMKSALDYDDRMQSGVSEYDRRDQWSDTKGDTTFSSTDSGDDDEYHEEHAGSGRNESDAITDYFKKIGMDDPRKK